MSDPGNQKERIEQLRREIEEHDRRYYGEARPVISDADYDALFRELRALEESHPDWITLDSPTQRVGGKAGTGFKQVRHAVPMLSLDNLFAKEGFEGLQKWILSVEKLLPGETLEWLVEPKIDGVAVSLRYEQGIFTVGATRGDGETGDDVTDNLKTIRAIPLRLKGAPEVTEVRGEVYMAATGFRRVCDTMIAAGEEPFANPRNATAGSLKLLDPRMVAKRPLEIVLYGLGEFSDDEPPTQAALLERLSALGFPVPTYQKICRTAEEVFAAIQELDAIRDTFGFETDGAVIKLNRVALRERAGYTARFPRWAKAWKYIAEQAETRLRDITIQVGRTGALTPVAELEPVLLRGSTISRATLHNEDEIRRKDIRVGDTVVIEKAGEVIPAVIRVVLEKRPEGTEPFDFEKHLGGKCPACGGPVRRDAKFAAWFCENVNCPAQKTRRLEYFAKRGALDLESLGGIVADKLVERGLVNDPLDVFDLQLPGLGALNLGTDTEPRIFGEKNAAKLMEAVQRARTLPLARWLVALAIPDVGEETAHDLAKFHRTIDEVAGSELLRDVIELNRLREEIVVSKPRSRANKEKSEPEKQQLGERYLMAIEQANAIGKRLIEAGFAQTAKKKGASDADAVVAIGPVAAKAVKDWFAGETGRNVLARLASLGISPEGKTSSPVSNGHPFAGKTFVITGSLTGMGRSEAADKIRAAGGNVSSSVSKKTGYLLVGENPGSKLEEALKHGVAQLTEHEFVALLAEKPAEKPAQKQPELF
ncbi:MAG: NAD-dependent DNA ligase LigA [Verrucomicrobiota bacterium]